MSDGFDGYVTEIPYTFNHFPEMAPRHLDLALVQVGVAPPVHDGVFNYLELGFGQGLGLTMLAAANPAAQFFGNDFMPAHVETARGLAAAAGADNLHLFEDSFTQLAGRALPAMDYIVLHGVYSWVNAHNRATIVALIDKLLKPGGVVYVSYNCLPGWSLKAPLQRFMSSFAAAGAGTVLERFHAAREVLGQLVAADAAFFAHHPEARALLREIEQASDAYLLHEFAPQGWSPFYHADVARDFAAADLTYAGSAKLFSNFPRYAVPAASRAVLEATQDAAQRELVRDFAVQTQLRRDVFVRAPQRLPAQQASELRRSGRLVLLRPRAACAMRAQSPLGPIDLNEPICAPLLDALAGGPRSLAVLMSLPELARHAPAEVDAAVDLLTCLHYVGLAPLTAPGAAARARAQGLNRALLARLAAGERVSGLVAASVGAGVSIAYHDLLFLCAQQQGPTEADALAAFALQVLQAQGGAGVDRARMQREAALFLRYGDAFYRSLELFG